MATFRYVFRDFEGKLKDPDSIKLSSEDEIYGVKRNDTGATVIPDGQDMSKVSTGIYEYGFADPSFGEYGLGLPYTASVESVSDGVTYFSILDDVRGVLNPTTTLYAQLTEFKLHIDYDGQGFTDTDAELGVNLEVASRLIDNYCNRSFYKEFPIDIVAIDGVIKQVCMAIAARLREDPDGLDTSATGESIGRYSYTGNSDEQSNIGGLTPNEYLQLKPYRRIKRA